MINSITTFLFGASGTDDYSNSRELISCNLHTTPADDGEWVFVDKSSTGEDPVEKGPLEDLLIAHPSMSVYTMLQPAASDSQEQSSTALAHSAEAWNALVTRGGIPRAPCKTSRAEPYNLRKTTMQKAKQTKKQSTKKFFNRNNQTTHYRKRTKPLSTPVVFQPRK